MPEKKAVIRAVANDMRGLLGVGGASDGADYQCRVTVGLYSNG